MKTMNVEKPLPPRATDVLLRVPGSTERWSMRDVCHFNGPTAEVNIWGGDDGWGGVEFPEGSAITVVWEPA